MGPQNGGRLLDGKVAVVTGGGHGIGRAVALGLARRARSVVVNDYGVSVDGRDPSSEPANAVVKEIARPGGRAVASRGERGHHGRRPRRRRRCAQGPSATSTSSSAARASCASA